MSGDTTTESILWNPGEPTGHKPGGQEVSSPIGGGGNGVTVTVSEDDPGAVGAGSLWVKLDPSSDYQSTQLYVRSDDDNDWVSAGAGLMRVPVPDGADPRIQVAVIPTGYTSGNDIGLFIEPGTGNPATNGKVQIVAYNFDAGSKSLIQADLQQVAVTWEGSTGHYAKFIGDDTGIALFTDGPLTLNGVPIGTQAAHVANGSTVDQLRDALIASGLMSAS